MSARQSVFVHRSTQDPAGTFTGTWNKWREAGHRAVHLRPPFVCTWACPSSATAVRRFSQTEGGEGLAVGVTSRGRSADLAGRRLEGVLTSAMKASGRSSGRIGARGSRGRGQSDGSGAAESRAVELPGDQERRRGRGCRGGGRAVRRRSSKNWAGRRRGQSRKACQRAKTADGERRTIYRWADGFECGLAWPDCSAMTYSGMSAAAPVEIPPLRQLRASNPAGS